MILTDLGLSTELASAVESLPHVDLHQTLAQARDIVNTDHNKGWIASQMPLYRPALVVALLEQLLQTPLKRGRRPIKLLLVTDDVGKAKQYGEMFKLLLGSLKYKLTMITGSESLSEESQHFDKSVDIVVATLNRLQKHFALGSFKLDHVAHCVVDNMTMLITEHRAGIVEIRTRLSEQAKWIVLATQPHASFDALSTQLAMPTPWESLGLASPQTVQQQVYLIERPHKYGLLIHLIKTKKWQRVLLVARTKHAAHRLESKLTQQGLSCTVVHSGKRDVARVRLLEAFDRSEFSVLIATENASRELALAKLDAVIHFELPDIADDFITRAKHFSPCVKEGLMLSLVCQDEEAWLRSITEVVDSSFVQMKDDSFVPDLQANEQEDDTERSTYRGRGQRNRLNNNLAQKTHKPQQQRPQTEQRLLSPYGNARQRHQLTQGAQKNGADEQQQASAKPASRYPDQQTAARRKPERPSAPRQNTPHNRPARSGPNHQGNSQHNSQNANQNRNEQQGIVNVNMTPFGLDSFEYAIAKENKRRTRYRQPDPMREGDLFGQGGNGVLYSPKGSTPVKVTNRKRRSPNKPEPDNLGNH